MFDNYKNDSKMSWKLINNLIGNCKNKKNISQMFLINGSQTSNEQQISEHFNSFFANIGSHQASKIPYTNPDTFKNYLKSPTPLRFHFKCVNPDEILKIISRLKPKTSCGDDGLSLKILKVIKTPISKAMSVIINQSFKTGIFPTSLKLAKVIPLFKKLDPSMFDNYRPISLLPSLSKIIEKVVHKQIYEYFHQHKLFYQLQHGFRPLHSTETATVSFIDMILNHLDNDKLPFSIFIDLSKAFDTLNHHILLHKLNYYGIQEISLQWFESYLSHRPQYVDYKGTRSTTKYLSVGVPQGSVLGPLLFLIYVNDINTVSSMFNCLLYADDTTLTSTISVPEINSIPIPSINDELDKIFLWMCSNRLSLNVSKTKCMIFHSPQRKVSDNILSGLKMNNTHLTSTREFNFLGTTITSTVSWKVHCSNICKKLSRIIGILKRLQNTVPTYVLLSIYNSMFVPYLYHSILLWGHCPYRIPSLQRKALRIVFKKKYKSHTNLLFKQYSLLKFEDMYKISCLKFYYKYINNMIPDCLSNMFSSEPLPQIYNLRHRTPRLQTTKKEFTSKCIRYMLPKLLNETDNMIVSKLHTHSLSGFTLYCKTKFISNYPDNCSVPNCYICLNEQ
jgi:hypothetical protein